MKILFFILAFLAPAPALAADNVALDSAVFVERSVTGADGKPSVVREEPKLVTPGDKLVFVLSYKNAGTAPADSFVVTNPIPASVSFVASDSPGADFSVDGGKSWGALAALKVKGADGKRSRRRGVRHHACPLGVRQGDPGRRRGQAQFQGHRSIDRSIPFLGATGG